MDFKRALVSPQKGTYCKSVRRLLEAKRAYFGFESHENGLQMSLCKGINCLWTTNRHSNRNYFGSSDISSDTAVMQCIKSQSKVFLVPKSIGISFHYFNLVINTFNFSR